MDNQLSKQFTVIFVLSIGIELFLLPTLVESRTVVVILVPKTWRHSPDEPEISPSRPYDARRFGLVPYDDVKKVYKSVLQQRRMRALKREKMMDTEQAKNARRFTVKKNSLSMLRGLNRNAQKYVNFRNYPTIANFEG